jgi:hypothetical protein
MKKLNFRKFKYVAYIIALTGGMALGFQNFTPKMEKESLGEKTQSVTADALTAALNAASSDHVEKQIALNVEPDQVMKLHKKDRRPQTVSIPEDLSIEGADSDKSLENADTFKDEDL